MATGTQMSDAFREDAMDELRHHRYHYVARPDYLTSLSWLSVPVHPRPHSSTSDINVLVNTHQGLVCSAVIGVINTDMAMDPHGNCTNPSQLIDASFQFSVSAPAADIYPQLHADFHLAMSRFASLQCLIEEPFPLEEGVVPFVDANRSAFSFYHPLFLPKNEHPLIRGITSFSLAEGFNTQPLIMARTHARTKTRWGRSPSYYNGRRKSYPIREDYQSDFLKIDKQNELQTFCIHYPDSTAVRIEDAAQTIGGLLALVEFVTGATVSGRMVSLVTHVHLVEPREESEEEDI